MTELLKINHGLSSETMTSLQIAEVTGKEHSNIMRDVRVLLEQVGELGGFKFELSSYKSLQNKDLPMYVLTKKECLLLASGYDALLRAKIINRWEELEEGISIKLPQTFSEALQLAANQAKEIEEKNALLLEQAPKVEFFDAVADSKDAVPMIDVAKVLGIKGMGRNNLFEFLRENKVLMNNNQPFQKHIDSGYFRVIEQRYQKNGEECINFKTLVYQKGIQYIKKLLNEK